VCVPHALIRARLVVLSGSHREFESIWDLWARQVQPLAAYAPYMTAVGNHEHYFNWTSYSNRFEMPANESGGFYNFYFSFDYGNVHFTCISSETNYTAGSPQYAWIQQDLAKANANRANVPWVIAVYHRPMVRM